MNIISILKQSLKKLKTEVLTLYCVARHPKTPWYAKVFIAIVVAYALSPIDLIPDFIPVLGYLDDLILVPLGIVLSLKMVPKAVVAECREQAHRVTKNIKTSWITVGIIVLIWLVTILLAGTLIVRWGKASHLFSI